jgi:hypothetical protein
MREFYWLWDEDKKESIQVPIDELDDELLERLRSVPALGGFCYAAEDFMHLPLTSAPFYIAGGWLPKQGKLMFFAPDKTGKSFLAMQLARCIGAGEDFLGFGTNQGKVLYVQFELGMETLQVRMRATGQDYTNVFVGTTFSMKLDEDAGKKQLRDAMKAVQPNVLIIDPLYKSINGDENLVEDMRKVADYLDELIEGFNCSVILMHHTGYDTSHGRGTTMWAGWVDSYIQVKKISKRGEPLRVAILPLSLRHAELPPEPVVAQLDDNFEFTLVEKENVATTYDKVLSYMAEKGEVETKDIMAAKLGSRTPVQRALNKLVEEEKVAQPRRGTYKYINAKEKENESKI